MGGSLHERTGVGELGGSGGSGGGVLAAVTWRRVQRTVKLRRAAAIKADQSGSASWAPCGERNLVRVCRQAV